jgi:hypothetical protein
LAVIATARTSVALRPMGLASAGSLDDTHAPITLPFVLEPQYFLIEVDSLRRWNDRQTPERTLTG